MVKEKLIKIGIIESSRLFREYLTDVINSESDMAVAFSASGLDKAPGSADVILLHWESLVCPHNGALDRAKLIVIDADSSRMDIAKCFQLGVSGFTLKDSPFEELSDTIRAVMAGDWVVPPSVSAKLYSQLAESIQLNNQAKLAYEARITPRERQIIPLILEGLTNKEIAQKLDIAIDTVKAHVRNILEKFDVHGRIELIKNSRKSMKIEGLYE
jgi:two-component system, NarL family, nitrate/nitrite response regulator NarL